MKAEEFKNIKIGDVFYAVINTGITGISKYQYIGVITCHATNEVKHVFLSEYLVSTICIAYGQEDKSRRLKDLHLTEESAKQWKRHLIDIDSEFH